MGTNTKTVGGGAATGTANDFQAFLRQQMTGQNQQQQGMGDQIGRLQRGGDRMGQMFGGRNPFQGEIDRLQNNFNQAGKQTGNATGGQYGSGGSFGDMYGQAASGKVTDQSGAFGQLQNFLGNGQNQYQNPYQSQTFQGFNPTQLGTNFGEGQSGMTNLGQYGNVGNTNVDVMQGFGSQGSSGFDSRINDMFGRGNDLLSRGGFNGGVSARDVQLDPAKQIDLNSPEIQAQQAIADRQKMLSVADTRARFGAEGAGALGTGAQVAEGTIAAEFGPKMAALLQQNIRQQQEMDLAQRQAKAGVSLQSAGHDLQGQIASMQGGLQNAAQNNSLYGQMLGAGMQGRGQDFQNQATNRGFDINQMGMGLNQAQGNQQMQLGQQGQMMNANLANQQMGNQWAQGNNAQNSQNMQMNNQNGMNQAQQQNQFNLNNAGNMAQYGQANNALNSQNWMQALQMGMGQNNFGQGMQNDLMRQLFGAYGQASGLGTPQAQTIQTPTMGSQILGAGLQLGGQFLGGGGLGMLAGMGGGGQANTQMPQIGRGWEQNVPWLGNGGQYAPPQMWGGGGFDAGFQPRPPQYGGGIRQGW